MAFIDDIQSRDTALFPIVEIKTPNPDIVTDSGYIIDIDVIEEALGIHTNDNTDSLPIGQYIKIDAEIMRITEFSEGFTIVIRGLLGTTIETHDSGSSIYIIGWNYISTKDFDLGNAHYYPFLLSTPSIKESIDLENRKYKISNVSLKISNVEYNGERFSDSHIALNTEVSIHWVSPSCTTIGQCYLAYKGAVRDITHDEKTCNITLEDISQSTLHRDVPIKMLSGDDVMDKYKNKPYPMVYGEVDRSPCIIEGLALYDDGQIGSSEINIISDNDTSITLNGESPLGAFYGGNYVNIARVIPESVGSDFGYEAGEQYEVSGDIMTLLTKYSQSGFFSNPIAENHIIGFESVTPSSIVPLQAVANIAGTGEEHFATLPYVDTSDGDYGSVIGRWRATVLREFAMGHWDGQSTIPEGDGGDGSDIWWDGAGSSGVGEITHLGVIIQNPIIGSTSYIDHFGYARSHWRSWVDYYYWWGADPTPEIDTSISSKDSILSNVSDGLSHTTILPPEVSDYHEVLVHHNSSEGGSDEPIRFNEPQEIFFLMHMKDGGHSVGVFEVYNFELDHWMLLDNMLKLDFYANNVTGRE